MDSAEKKALIEHLAQFVTEPKLELMQRVLDSRTRALTVVLEDIFQPHNASAALRSCECFGVQDIHIVENRYEYRVNRDVVMGASKWIDLKRHNEPGADNTTACLQGLKEAGYVLAATALREDTMPLHELPVDRKVALLFGTEEEGLSDTALNLADAYVKIPMHGFTQSFNISVSVAVCLYELSGRIRRERNDWQLNEEDRDEVLLNWLRRTVRNAEIIERQFLKS